METIIMIYKLNKGISKESYKKFSIDVDQPLVKGFKAVKDFSVCFVEGDNNDCDVFEVIIIDSYKAWTDITETEAMKNHIKEWVKLADESTVKVFYGNKIQ